MLLVHIGFASFRQFQFAPSPYVNSITGLQIYRGPGSLSRDFKKWPITFQGSGPFLLVVKKSHFNKKYSSYTKQKVHVRCQYSKTCL